MMVHGSSQVRNRSLDRDKIMYYESGTQVNILFGKYKGKSGTYSRYSLSSGMHIIGVENLSIPGQFVEIALKDGEFSIG